MTSHPALFTNCDLFVISSQYPPPNFAGRNNHKRTKTNYTMKKGFVISMFSAFVLSFALTSCTDNVVSDLSADEQLTAERRFPQAPPAGNVYLIDNDASDNHVIGFDRGADGSLSNMRTWSTGGAGTGGGLGSQSAVVRYLDYLLVVNAGSNQISAFRVNGQNLTLTDVEDSHGVMPISLTAGRNMVYVLNAGGNGNIAGFMLSGQGDLTYISGSSQPLSTSSAGGAQIAFNSTSRLLVVTEKATNSLSVYSVDNLGVASAPTTYPSAGATPFGFDFGRRDMIFVSEAAGGAAGASTLSSYKLNYTGTLDLITGAMPTYQSAACWAVVSGNGQYGYLTNTGSANVTGFSISPSGEVSLLNSGGATGSTGAGPIDAGFSRNSDFLYTLNAGSDSITMFAVGADGSLYNLGELTGLPNGAAGLAAE